MTMTPTEVAAAIAQLDAERQAAAKAARAAILPHVRRPIDRSKLSRHAAASPHNRVPIGAECTGTYCGAPMTSEDWDGRTAASKAHAAAADATVCPACLELVRA
jgi:hypothetical protein